MAKIGINKTVGQAKTGTMRVQNATASGFGIIYADEIIGHRRVDTFEDLAKIPNWALYDSKGGDNISTAKGQLWYVSGDSKLYQLTGIDASGANRTWTEFKGTDSSYSLPVMTDTVLGGAKLKYNTTQTIGANAVSTTTGRTYAVQKNSDNQLVVNVPWTEGRNDNTTYTFANGTDGSFTVTPSGGTAQKVSIGTPENANHANMANSAGSATNDAQGHSIHLTYATKTEMASGLNGLDSKISALTSALVYKGTVDATNPLPTKDVKVGDVYVVAAPGTYAGQKCENGDMIIAKVGGNTPAWTIVQTNIDGAVTTTATALTDNSIILGAGNKTLKSFAPLTTDGYLYWSGSEYAWKKPEEFSLKPASSTALGGIKTGFTSTNDRQYAVQLDDNDKAFVNVPWTDTDTKYTLPAAKNGVLGGIRTDYNATGKNYAVKTDTDGKAYVTVDWKNTEYTAGSGINISGNTIGWDDAAASNLADVFDSGFKGYVAQINKNTKTVGDETQTWLTYLTGGTKGKSFDLIRIYDKWVSGADGLASMSALGNVANDITTEIADTYATQTSVSTLGNIVNGKVNITDKITEADINALFTNN